MPSDASFAAALAIRTGLSPARTKKRLKELEDSGHLIPSWPVGAVLETLVEHLLVHETYFYRHPVQLEFLRAAVFPLLDRQRITAERSNLLLWSAGCATGEEAWTLALLAEHLPFRMLATDLSLSALHTARAGHYTPSPGLDSFRSMPDAARARLGHGPWHAPEHLRSRLTFARHNVLTPSPVTSVDLILCRNVMIYFDAAGVATAQHHLAAALRPGGILLLGPADPEPTTGLGLVPIRHGEATAWQRPAG